MTILYEPKVGRPLALNEAIVEKILENVPRGLRPETIANLSLIPPTSLRRWLKTGQQDAEKGENTIFAQFWLKFNQKKAEKVIEWLNYVGQCLPNWQAAWELIRAVAREDFGVDAVEYKELLDLYTKLREDVKGFMENNLTRIVNNGKEMDSESN